MLINYWAIRSLSYLKSFRANWLINLTEIYAESSFRSMKHPFPSVCISFSVSVINKLYRNSERGDGGGDWAMWWPVSSNGRRQISQVKKINLSPSLSSLPPFLLAVLPLECVQRGTRGVGGVDDDREGLPIRVRVSQKWALLKKYISIIL